MGRSLSAVTDTRTTVAVTTNHNILSGEILLIDTTAGTELTLTLPANPRAGDRVNLIDAAGQCGTTKAIIARNGNKIAALAEDLDFDIKNTSLEFIYTGSSYGWSILSN
tara:strand:+ start:19655 stop:19981 length:327 start_codon:yes stop_codon:yes gene_type:complete